MSIVSNNIKYLRRLNGLTQEQFARKIGIKRSLVGAYEEARANPNLDNLKNMAFVFGVTVDNLVKNDLRKLRETPDLNLPFSNSPVAAISDQTEKEEEEWPAARPFAAIMERFQQSQPPTPTPNVTLPPDDMPPGRPSEGFAPSGDELLDAMMKPVEAGYQKVVPKEKTSGPIRLVRGREIPNYLHLNSQESFIASLPVIQLPGLPDGHYRAFEAGKDFFFPNSVIVGAKVDHVGEVKDNTQYIFILRSRGLVYRRAFNQLRTKGVLLLSSDLPQTQPIEVPARDIIEVWETRAMICYQIPEPSVNFGRLQQLVDELQQELGKS